MLIAIESSAVLATAILSFLWLRHPGGSYEPWTVLCGVILSITELIRRSRDKNILSQSLSRSDRLLTWIEEKGTEKPLSQVLPRMLDLAQELHDDDLEHWVRLELYGYDPNGGMLEHEIVPEYRTVVGRYFDQFNREFQSIDQDLSFLNAYRIRYGVGKLEELAGRREMQNIRDGNMNDIFKEYLGWEPVRFCFSPVEVAGVLSQIRNRLLERSAVIARRIEEATVPSKAERRFRRTPV
jgi:hypothetical protein